MNSPYFASCPTEAAETSGKASAQGSPRPKLTAVTGLRPLGSSAATALPSQPSGRKASGVAVCQMSIERKCDRLESG